MRALLDKYLKVIDWYIIRKYMGTFVFTLGLFIVVTVVFDISEKLDNFLKNNVTLHDIIFQYYAGFVPFYINFLTPLINFLAVIFFTAKMANQTEIVPILSGKASFKRFLRPYYVCATIIFVVSLIANVFIIPVTNKLKTTFENKFVNNDDPTKVDVHMQLDKHTYIFLANFDQQVHAGYQFVLEKFDGDQLREKLVANMISYDSVKRVWSIKNFTVRYVNGMKEKMTPMILQKDTVLDMRPDDFVQHEGSASAMPRKELDANIDKARIRGTGELTDLLLERYRRFIYPLSSYVLTLIGVSISSRKVRGGIGLPLGIGIFLCFAYIVTVQFANVFSIKGGLPPFIAVCIPNVLFGALAYYLLLKAPK